MQPAEETNYLTEFGEFLDFDASTRGDIPVQKDDIRFIAVSSLDIGYSSQYQRVQEAVDAEKRRIQQEKEKSK